MDILGPPSVALHSAPAGAPLTDRLPRPERAPAQESQLSRVLGVLRRRWRLLASFAAAGVLLMGIGSLLMPREYTATAVLHVKNQPPHVTNIPQVIAPPTYFESVEFFQDQVKFLESRSLAARVIREEGLAEEPRFTEAEQEWPLVRAVRLGTTRLLEGVRSLVRNDDASTAQDSLIPAEPVLGVSPELIGRYGRWLEVQPITNSRLIELKFTSPSAALSQRVANAHARNYIHQSLQSKFELTGEARKFLEAEVARVENELGKAEAALDAFRRKHTVVTLSDTQNANIDRLGDLGRRLTEAQAQRIGAEAEYRLIEGREGDALPGVLTNPLVQGLKQEMSRLEIRHAELSEVFLPKTPQLREIESQLSRARVRLRQEIDRAVGGIESAYLAAVARENALREQFAAQQDAVLDMKALSGQYVKLDQTVNTTRELYGTLLQRLQETDVVKGVQLANATVLDPAERPGMPSHPAIPFNLAFGLLLGTGIGLAVVLALEAIDGSLKTPQDVRDELALPTLGVVPDFSRVRHNRLGSMRPRSLLASRRQPVDLVPERSPTAEAYRSVRTSVLFFNPAQPPRSLLVTSSQPREGKTATTVNLGLCLAQLDRRVVIVDADMRQARCHRALDVPAGVGLSEVLRDQVALDHAIRRLVVQDGRVRPATGDAADGPELHLLPAGLMPPDPSALLASARMDAVLRELLDRYDMVLIDSPPVFPITDSAVLAPRVDGVVLVVRGHTTDRQVSREALNRLRYMNANVLGVVLNGVDPASTAYHSYAYYFAA